jgi:phosphoglycolate phosphatase-like HAD superfamily hydrolase
VVSATPDREIKEIIERRGLSRYFEDIRGSSQAKSENVRDLLKHYGLSARRCVFFGDAESDYRAASENGMPFIGILPDENAPLLQIVSSITWYSNFISLDESMAP